MKRRIIFVPASIEFSVLGGPFQLLAAYIELITKLFVAIQPTAMPLIHFIALHLSSGAAFCSNVHAQSLPLPHLLPFAHPLGWGILGEFRSRSARSGDPELGNAHGETSIGFEDTGKT